MLSLFTSQRDHHQVGPERQLVPGEQMPEVAEKPARHALQRQFRW
jgi:hypothetical protein